MADEVVTETPEASEAEVKEARVLGWSAREEWRGNPEDWVDARTFLERGKHILPMLQSNNKRLMEELRVRDSKLSSMERSLSAANAAIEALQTSQAEDVKAQVEAARAELRTEMASALESGDHARAAELTEKMTQLNSANADAGGEEKSKVSTAQPVQMSQEMRNELQSWYDKNPAYKTDNRRIALLNAVAVELRNKGDTRVGAAFLDAVAEEVDNTLGPSQRGGASKVSSDNGGGGRTGSGAGSGKTYADLPQEAKTICDKQASRLVGPNRAHKTIESWRNSYARQYFQE